MKTIKLSGREIAVLRAIDFATGTPGDEVMDRTKIPPDELVPVVNGLLQVGYVETNPPCEVLGMEELPGIVLDVNPSYVHELREAMRRGR